MSEISEELGPDTNEMAMKELNLDMDEMFWRRRGAAVLTTNQTTKQSSILIRLLWHATHLCSNVTEQKESNSGSTT